MIAPASAPRIGRLRHANQPTTAPITSPGHPITGEYDRSSHHVMLIEMSDMDYRFKNAVSEGCTRQ